MKKQLLIISFLFLFVGFATAQKGNILISLGADVALPLGDFGDYSNIGIGGTAKGHYGISDAGDITFTTGYISFGSKGSNEFMSIKTAIIPFMPGYRHTFDGFYVEPQIGLVSYKTKVKSDILDGFGMGSASGSSSHFSFAAGVGKMFGNLDVSARFQMISSGGSANFIAARVGYVLFSK